MVVFQYLAGYTGRNALPNGSDNGYFCQYIGIEQWTDQESEQEDASFRNVVLSIVGSGYEKAGPDIYFRIKSIKKGNTLIKLETGKLNVEEGDEITIHIEDYNPNLDNSGYPQSSQTDLVISCTTEDKVTITPRKLTLTKYGKHSVNVKFNRNGAYKGDLLFEPGPRTARIASFRIPFEVDLKEGENRT